MSFVVVVPARYASTRLPGKPLLDIRGKPMVQWVVEAAAKSRAVEVVVATDDERIARAVSDPRNPNARIAMLTRPEHPSGTDRIAEVANAKGWSAETIVVNVQGDEPQLPPALIDQVADLLAGDPQADMATLCTPILSSLELLDPNVVKVVVGDDGAALYFSRAPIPWSRDTAADGLLSQTYYEDALRHLGIYAYRVGALVRMTQSAPSPLEQLEKLEQLRALQMGMRILVAQAKVLPGVGVDTPDDLERARRS
ncbi:MAG TPA: 3-deoxy-manno-octulosonate cytidylyltransferase [Steroidobacteraceae bacterium]|nr:3-deoxy-manno-octulosonate cytidylyltransferase [Steroidobacteraceae bacterium]